MRKTNIALILGLALACGCKSTHKPSAPEPGPAAGAQPAEQAAGEAAAGQLAGDAQKVTLREQRTSILVEQHIAQSRQLLEQVRFDEAQREVESALELEPDSLAAQKLRAEILSIKGQKVGSTQSTSEQMTELYKLRVQQMRADAQDGLQKAKLMIARSDYGGAVAELEIVNNLVHYAPYSIDWQGQDSEARTLLESTRATREQAERSADERKSLEAFAALQAEESVKNSRRTAQIANTLEQGVAAFDRADYEEAETLAKQVLEKDARNEKAEELRDAAFRAGRTQVQEDYVQRKKEQFRRWEESLKEMQIPWTPTITNPGPEHWNEITALRSKRRGFDLSQKVSEGEHALRAQLKTTLVLLPKVKDEESLSKVIDMVKTITGLPLVVDPAADAASTSGGVVFNFSLEHKVTAEQALNLIVGMVGEAVTWTIKHDVVLVTTKEKARGKPIIVNHDVQDLIFGLTDFMGPRINQIRLIDKMQDDDGGGPFGGIGEKPKLIEPGDLSTLIQENVAVGTWQQEGISIDAHEGYILISHTPEVQDQVRSFLEDLRRFNSSLVTIESKFLTVSKNWLQEIGVDFRGLDTQSIPDVTNGLEDMASRGLDNGGSGSTNGAGHPSAGIFYDQGTAGAIYASTENFYNKSLGSALSNIGGMTVQMAYLSKLDLSAILRAVEKSTNIELVNDQVLSVHNTQRAYVTVINQRAYIQDFDVEVAQFQAVADPQVNVLNEGVVLDVRPTIHHDRKYLTLEIQPTVAKLVALRNFSSTLGGNTSPVEFQLPEVQVQSVFTTAIIPDGGSIMLGGLSNVRNVERRAEVPWFAKIPILGFFFKQEGYSDENKSLMILIRARITDVRDELKRLEATR
jgi:type II secretory pathway component GspD/PulD (secretin)